MAYNNLHYIPICFCILLPTTFLITFVWAVILGHVEPGIPYISHTGTLPPESCFFSQMLFFATILLGWSVYLRYRQVAAMSSREVISRRVNIATAWIGIVACLGLSFVGNFQESNVMAVHIFGALLCFICGTIYICLQTWFSHRLEPQVNKSWVLSLRVVLSVLSITFAFIMFTCSIVAFFQYKGKNRLKWRPEDGGWIPHIISSAAEWTLAACFCIFFLTLVEDFSMLTMHSPRVDVSSFT